MRSPSTRVSPFHAVACGCARRARELHGPAAVGFRRIRDDRQIHRERSLARNAGFAADQPFRFDLDMRARSRRCVRRHAEGDREHDFAVVAEVVEAADIEALRQRPGDLLGLEAGRQRPAQRRRQAGVAGIDPVRVPVRLVPQQEAELKRLAGHDRGVLADQLDLDVLGFGCVRPRPLRDGGRKSARQQGATRASQHLHSFMPRLRRHHVHHRLCKKPVRKISPARVSNP